MREGVREGFSVAWVLVRKELSDPCPGMREDMKPLSELAMFGDANQKSPG